MIQNIHRNKSCQFDLNVVVLDFKLCAIFKYSINVIIYRLQPSSGF